MKKILNLAFYKSIINSDFSLLSLKSNRNTHYIKSDLQIDSYNRIKTLDIFLLLKSCKQFIRVLQFVKENKLAEVNIIVSNKQYFYLLKHYLIDYPVDRIINVYYLIKEVKKQANTVEFDIFIGDSKFYTHTERVQASVINKTFLIQIINDSIDCTQKGTYKIYNDTLDFKKIVFIVSLLKLVFKNKV